MKYLTDGLTPCQTGFVPKMGIQVNLIRALYWIKTATDEKCNKYGLFIDFANAYNTVPHELLFKKLREKKCLDEEEIDYLEALYNHYRIRIGSRIITYNKGVAQGSILSPALFNIFVEDLVEKLSKELNLHVEDILLYADDILLLCDSPEQVRKCIQIVERWSKENGMELNKKKSGIVVFAPRLAKKIPYMKLQETEKIKENKKTGEKAKVIVKEWVTTGEEIDGVPIVNKYKYLGTYLDSKLTLSTQLNFIRQKSNFLFTKLYPYLINASAHARKNMWRTMVYPLFNGVLGLLQFEYAKSNNENLLRLWRYTFKKFLMIPQNTNTELVDDMIGITIDQLRCLNTEASLYKWKARREKTELVVIEKPEFKDYLKGLSNDWCSIISQQCGLCALCDNTTRNYVHMKEVHGIEIIPYKDIWKMIKEFYDHQEAKQKKKNKIMKVKRKVFIDKWKPTLKQIKEINQEKLDSAYKRGLGVSFNTYNLIMAKKIKQKKEEESKPKEKEKKITKTN
jgi:hypothetical protein